MSMATKDVFLEEPIIMHLLSFIKGSHPPMVKSAAMYMLKDLFQQSLNPRNVALSIGEGLLFVLLEILGKDFNPQDESNDVTLYSLSMEILWFITSLPFTEHRPLISQIAIRHLTGFCNIQNRFYQFSPLFTLKLKETLQNKSCHLHSIFVKSVTPIVRFLLCFRMCVCFYFSF